MARHGRWRAATSTRRRKAAVQCLELEMVLLGGLRATVPSGEGMHPKVAALAGRTQYEQRTPPWYEVRKCMLTASDAYAALDIPCYENFKGSTRKDLLKKKARAACEAGGGSGGSSFMAHGVKYEDEARLKYEALAGERVLEYGLMTHPDPELAWLGASPDGVCETSGRLVEVKCPVSRVIEEGQVPHHYMPQLQVCMEVFDLDEAVFIQYKPSCVTWPKPEEFDITLVPRDRQWFADKLPLLQKFYDEMKAAQEAARAMPAPPDEEPKAKRARVAAPVVCQMADDLYG